MKELLWLEAACAVPRRQATVCSKEVYGKLEQAFLPPLQKRLLCRSAGVPCHYMACSIEEKPWGFRFYVKSLNFEILAGYYSVKETLCEFLLSGSPSELYSESCLHTLSTS